MSLSESNRCVKVPIDMRLLIAALWTASLVLLLVDSFGDDDIPDGAAWSVIVGIGALALTGAYLLDRALRILLEVMSFEHRQFTEVLRGEAPRSEVTPLR